LSGLKRLLDVAAKVIHNTTKYLMWIGVAIICIIILLVVANVIGRYGFRNPLLGHVETVQLLSVALVFFIMAYTECIDGHIKVNLVTRLLSKRVQRILGVITTFLGVVFAAVMCYRGVVYGFANIFPLLTQTEALFIPYAPFVFCLALGSLLLALALLINCLRYIYPSNNRKGERHK
jgi:TRAP-type C4-dicarboxylate transport system permease small subunit